MADSNAEPSNLVKRAGPERTWTERSFDAAATCGKVSVCTAAGHPPLYTRSGQPAGRKSHLRNAFAVAPSKSVPPLRRRVHTHIKGQRASGARAHPPHPQPAHMTSRSRCRSRKGDPPSLRRYRLPWGQWLKAGDVARGCQDREVQQQALPRVCAPREREADRRPVAMSPSSRDSIREVSTDTDKACAQAQDMRRTPHQRCESACPPTRSTRRRPHNAARKLLTHRAPSTCCPPALANPPNVRLPPSSSLTLCRHTAVRLHRQRSSLDDTTLRWRPFRAASVPESLQHRRSIPSLLDLRANSPGMAVREPNATRPRSAKRPRARQPDAAQRYAALPA